MRARRRRCRRARSASSSRPRSTSTSALRHRVPAPHRRHARGRRRAGPTSASSSPATCSSRPRAGASMLTRNHALQRVAGVDVALLTPDALRERFPWLSSDDLALGSLGLSGEGWFDGRSLLQAFVASARRAARVTSPPKRPASTSRAERSSRCARRRLANRRRRVRQCRGPVGRTRRALARHRPAGRARRRDVFVFSCPRRLPGCPLVIDPSGLWFRPEGEGYICGVSPTWPTIPTTRRSIPTSPCSTTCSGRRSRRACRVRGVR